MRPQSSGRQAERATESNWEGYARRATEDLGWDKGGWEGGEQRETYEVDAKC